MNLAERLRQAALEQQDRGAFEVLRFDLSAAGDGAELGALLDRHPDVRGLDCLDEQVRELLVTRAPGDREAGSAASVAAHIESHGASGYGCWVYLPWRRLLVRVLPEADFVELRTNRNQLSLLPAEQRALRDKHIAIVGLSVGHSMAVTLALEGIGGSFLLADPDALELSNTNRVAVGVAALGVNKAVLAAQRMLEIDPFLRVEVWPRGVDFHAADALFRAKRPDLLIEECDDLPLKVRLRELAREQRVPVITETSQRGLIDVERFDHEPSRPPFHGLLGDVEASALAGLSTREKGPFVLRFMEGVTHLSDRLAASLVELDQTLKGWPQLGPDVVFGGAVVANVARRVLLGSFRQSGRFRLDVGEWVADASPAQTLRDALPPTGFEPARRAASEAGEAPRRGQLSAWLDAARWAPSGGNSQPWSFTAVGELSVRCAMDASRGVTLLDPRGLAGYAACGAALENMRLAAARDGYAAEIDWRVGPGHTEVCELRFLRDEAVAVDPLVEWLRVRCTNRRRQSEPVPAGAGEALGKVAREGGLLWQWVDDPDELLAIASALGELERLRLLCAPLYREMMGELRLGPQAGGAPDGIEEATLELAPGDEVALAVLQRGDVVQLLRTLDRGDALRDLAAKAVLSAPAFARLSVVDETPLSFARAGMAMQRVWLSATALGLSLQPLTAGAFMLAQLSDSGCSKLPEADRERLRTAAPRFRACFPLVEGQADLLLFRVFVAPPPSARSGRRPLEDVFRVTA